MSTNYDFIIIGTGAGGGTIANRLAHAGKRLLILERGTFLPREKENWSTKEVFLKNRYHTTEVWQDKEGKPLHPGTGYWVGGNTKVYGAALFRLRKEDFGELRHEGGISPAWPLGYETFEPYYTRAEKLFDVHGQRGIDPTEPPMSSEYPYPAVSNEPRIQELFDGLKHNGYHPFPVPVGLKLNEKNREDSTCIRCDTCDGYPCLADAKADADVNCIRPIHHLENVTLVTGAHVLRLLTSVDGRTITDVEFRDSNGDTHQVSGDKVIVSCGAINSAALLLRSANDKHPNGLANSSDQVGRNFMFHQAGAILSIHATKKNLSRYQKTFSVNDFYFGEPGYDFPMGNIQLIGSFHHEMMIADAPPLTPGLVLEEMASHAVPWWLTTEDLPDPENRVLWIDGKIQLNYTPNNVKSFERLMHRWTEVLKQVDGAHVIPHELYFSKRIPLEGVGHQNGTCRFGSDSKTSVLDLNCRTHDVDNLYVVDGSFFVSSGAVNPSLTIIANALRVGDHLLGENS
jgi:choline dehydrogenase-like flavoprotein